MDFLNFNFRTLPWWNSDSANMINGTGISVTINVTWPFDVAFLHTFLIPVVSSKLGGTRFKPFIEKDDELYVFVTEICRYMYKLYNKLSLYVVG